MPLGREHERGGQEEIGRRRGKRERSREDKIPHLPRQFEVPVWACACPVFLTRLPRQPGLGGQEYLRREGGALKRRNCKDPLGREQVALLCKVSRGERKALQTARPRVGPGVPRRRARNAKAGGSKRQRAMLCVLVIPERERARPGRQSAQERQAGKPGAQVSSKPGSAQGH